MRVTASARALNSNARWRWSCILPSTTSLGPCATCSISAVALQTSCSTCHVYAVARYGRTRNIGRATFGQLGELRFDTRFDLIVCSDMLHYVPARELQRGLSGFGDLLEGLAFLEVFTARDHATGDIDGFIARSAAWYRARFIDAGLLPCGSHGYLSSRLMRSVAALEVCG